MQEHRALLEAIRQEQLGLRQMLQAQQETNQRVGILLSTLVLQDAATTLDLLHLQGLAERLPFNTVNSIAAAANADVVDLTPPAGWVGFWRNLEIVVTVSHAMTMRIFIEEQRVLEDTSLVNRDIISPRVWLPFFNRFRVNVTNDDVATQTVVASGFRVFLLREVYDDIRRTLEAGLTAARLVVK